MSEFCGTIQCFLWICVCAPDCKGGTEDTFTGLKVEEYSFGGLLSKGHGNLKIDEVNTITNIDILTEAYRIVGHADHQQHTHVPPRYLKVLALII